jgi:hypothetical protein
MRWRMSELTGEVEVRVEECKGRRRVVFLNNQEQRYAIFHKCPLGHNKRNNLERLR